MWLSPEGHGLTKIGSIQADICIVTEKLESVQEIRAARVADIRLAANDLRSRVLELENQLRYAKDQLKELEEQDSRNRIQSAKTRSFMLTR
jgi:TolA-binding protein